MADDFILGCIIGLAALSPILRRLYIEYFWACGRGTVIGFNFDSQPGEDADPAVPMIEFYVAGQRFVFGKRAWLKRYKTGDEVEILYNPKNPRRFTMKGWWPWIVGAVFVGVFLAVHVTSRNSAPPG